MVVVVEEAYKAANLVAIVSVGYGFSTDGLFDIVSTCGYIISGGGKCYLWGKWKPVTYPILGGGLCLRIGKT